MVQIQALKPALISSHPFNRHWALTPKQLRIISRILTRIVQAPLTIQTLPFQQLREILLTFFCWLFPRENIPLNLIHDPGRHVISLTQTFNEIFFRPIFFVADHVILQEEGLSWVGGRPCIVKDFSEDFRWVGLAQFVTHA